MIVEVVTILIGIGAVSGAIANARNAWSVSRRPGPSVRVQVRTEDGRVRVFHPKTTASDRETILKEIDDIRALLADERQESQKDVPSTPRARRPVPGEMVSDDYS